MSQRRTLVVAGHGPVGHRFVLTERCDGVALASFPVAGSADERSWTSR